MGKSKRSRRNGGKFDSTLFAGFSVFSSRAAYRRNCMQHVGLLSNNPSPDVLLHHRRATHQRRASHRRIDGVRFGSEHPLIAEAVEELGPGSRRRNNGINEPVSL